LLGSSGAASRRRDENIDLEIDELGGQRGEALDVSRRLALFEDGVTTFDISYTPQPVLKGSDPALGLLESL